jgi:hypothetical protein
MGQYSANIVLLEHIFDVRVLCLFNSQCQHLGINSKEQDRRFTPTAHSYETYLGAPYTNAPMCEMDSDGISQKIHSGKSRCWCRCYCHCCRRCCYTAGGELTLTRS